MATLPTSGDTYLKILLVYKLVAQISIQMSIHYCMYSNIWIAVLSAHIAGPVSQVRLEQRLIRTSALHLWTDRGSDFVDTITT